MDSGKRNWPGIREGWVKARKTDSFSEGCRIRILKLVGNNVSPRHFIHVYKHIDVYSHVWAWPEADAG